MCCKKFHFISSVNPRCFWNMQFFKGILLNKRDWCSSLFVSAKYYLLNLFSQIRTWNQFPLKSSSAYNSYSKSLLKVVLLTQKLPWLTWMLLTIEKKKYRRQKAYSLKILHLINNLCKLTIIMALKQNLGELPH